MYFSKFVYAALPNTGKSDSCKAIPLGKKNKIKYVGVCTNGYFVQFYIPYQWCTCLEVSLILIFSIFVTSEIPGILNSQFIITPHVSPQHHSDTVEANTFVSVCGCMCECK